MLQPTVLILQVLEPLYIACRHPGVLRLPVVLRSIANPVLPTQLSHSNARFPLLQNAYDLLLCIPRLLHPCLLVRVSYYVNTLLTSGTFFGGQVR